MAHEPFETLSDLQRFRANQHRIESAVDYIKAKVLHRPMSEWPADFRKAAVAGIHTGTTDAFSGALSAFKDYLLAPTILSQLRGVLRVDPNVPIPSETTDDGTMYWVAEGLTIPATTAGFTTTTLLLRKLAALVVITHQLARVVGPSGTNAILRLFRGKATRGLDVALLGSTAASDAQPAGLLAGVTGLTGGSPVSATSIEELIAVVSDGRPSTPVFICSPRAAAFLAQQEGNAFKNVRLKNGDILGAPLLVSPGAGANLILADASEIAVFDGELEIDFSGEADLQQVDNPATGAAAMVSMFQSGATVARLVHNVSWAKLSDDAVGYIELDAIGVSPA